MSLENSKNDLHWKVRTKLKQWLKNQKARKERRKAKNDPESQPTYGRYRGWAS